MTMRESYEQFLALYGPTVERGSIDDAMLRGAFSAGVIQGLGIAKLGPEQALAALEQMSAELEAFWEKEPPGDAPADH